VIWVVVGAGMPQARANAAAAMYLLSTLEGVREEIPQAGAVPALVSLLEEGSDGGKKDADCLLSICLHKDNRREVAEVSQEGGTVLYCMPWVYSNVLVPS